MQVQKSDLVRHLQGMLSDQARVCTRYNKPSVSDKLGDITVTCHDTKLVIADYGHNGKSDSGVSFTLKIWQIVADNSDGASDDVLATMRADAIAHIQKGDSNSKLVATPADALKHSGLNSSYVHVLHFIAHTVTVDGGQYIASDTFGNPCVGLVFTHADSVFILQFTD